MNIFVKHFSLTGRIPRSTFFKFTLIDVSIALVFAFGFIFTGDYAFNGDGDFVRSSIFVLSLLGLIVVSAHYGASFWRRVHDLGFTNRKQIILIFIASLITLSTFIVSMVIDKNIFVGIPFPVILVDFLKRVGAVTFFILAILMFGAKGTTGPNSYGEDPLDTPQVHSMESPKESHN